MTRPSDLPANSDLSIWKLSMGTHAGGGEFVNRSVVDSWIIKNTVLVWGPTGAKGGSGTTQGDYFKHHCDGHFFYLCHGNYAVILLGKFTGGASLLTPAPSGFRKDWYGRPFKVIAKAVSATKYSGRKYWWAPNHNSTFVKVPPRDMNTFESLILQPYFTKSLNDLRKL